MKKIISLILSFIMFSCLLSTTFLGQNIAFAEQKAPQKVYHLFTHSLIANKKVAFDEDNPLKKHLLADCITAEVFQYALEMLYENDYILVSPQDTYEEINGKMVRKYINIPEGKKPLILSFDDINYYRSKKGQGFVDKLVLKNGEVVAEMKDNSSGEIFYSKTNECVPILNAFVKEHPDFSYNNAKGTLFLTGFDGILGYRTQSGSENRQEELENVKPIVENLKQNGWTFGCHTYGHGHMKKQSVEKFKEHTDKWEKEVAPIVGKTNLYCYPYGEWELTNEQGEKSEKHAYLKEKGYNFFFGVGSPYYFVSKNNGSYLFMDRTPLDGQTIRSNPQVFVPFFGEEKITMKEE